MRPAANSSDFGYQLEWESVFLAIEKRMQEKCLLPCYINNRKNPLIEEVFIFRENIIKI